MSYLGKTGAVPKQGLKKKAKPKRDYAGEIKSEKREKTLWKWFSLYIRLRDAPDNGQGFQRCFTCGKVSHFKEMDAGHYVRQKNHKATVYEEKNVHAQCKNCNMILNGNEAVHAQRIDERYGKGTAEQLEAQGRVLFKKRSFDEVKEMSDEYRFKAKDEAYRVGVEIR